MRRAFAAILLALVLGGCAAVAERPPMPPLDLPPLTSYFVDGRFAVSGTPQPVSGRLNWQHAGAHDTLLLQDPFGRGLAEIALAPGDAQLRRSDGEVRRAASASELARQVFDIDLPLDRLGVWLTARLPTPVDAPQHDALGRLVAWRLADWEIRYDYPDPIDAQALPERVSVRRDDGVVVRVRIDRWEPGPPP